MKQSESATFLEENKSRLMQNGGLRDPFVSIPERMVGPDSNTWVPIRDGEKLKYPKSGLLPFS